MKKCIFILLSLWMGLGVFAQDSLSVAAEEPATPKKEYDFRFRPIVGLGIGMMNYYGELSKGERSNNPLVNNLGYEAWLGIHAAEPLDIFIKFYRGDISANATLDNNLNFSSQLTAAGIHFQYNFANVLERDRQAEPYVSIGFESIEFLAKTDLFDEFGNEYFYWEDGTIRNLPESPENEANAIRIQRDYQYETDIRTLDFEGQGPFVEQTFAIPVGIGVNLRLHEKVKFRVGTSMHFTFSDRMDGISADGQNERSGDAAADRFLFSSFSLMWDFTGNKKDKKEEKELSKTDYLAIDKGDYDDDGIIDFDDECPNTPRGIAVEENGCPADGDKDGVPDAFDQELTTAEGAAVDSLGVTISDEAIYESYMRYLDTAAAGAFEDTSYALQMANKTKRNRVQTRFVPSGGGGITVTPSSSGTPTQAPAQTPKSSGSVVSTQKPADALGEEAPLTPRKIYRVQVAAVSKFIKDERFKQVPGLVFLKFDDGLIRYFSGGFETRAEAEVRREELKQLGFKDAFIKVLQGGKEVKE